MTPTDPTPADEGSTARAWIKPLVVVTGLLAAAVLLFQFVLGPMVYETSLDRMAADDGTHDRLLAKYDIETIEFKVEKVGTGPGRQAGVPVANKYVDVYFALIDGVRRDCELVDEDTDPTLACEGWEAPLRSESGAPVQP